MTNSDGWIEDEIHNEGEADGRQFLHLADALRRKGTTIANTAFITQLMSRIDVDAYFERSSYIRVVRRSGGPDLHIAFGFTNGFRTREELVEAAGDRDIWPSKRIAGTWGVTHPDNKMHSAHGSRMNRTGRDGTACPICGMVMPLSGVCDEQH